MLLHDFQRSLLLLMHQKNITYIINLTTKRMTSYVVTQTNGLNILAKPKQRTIVVREKIN